MVELLSNSDIETAIKKTRNGIIQGISFKLDRVSFPGNKLGSDYSYGRLVERVEIVKDIETDSKPLKDFDLDEIVDQKDLKLLWGLKRERAEKGVKIKHSKAMVLEW